MKAILLGVMAAMLLTGPLSAVAIPINYSLTFTAGTGGGTNGVGTFTFDAATDAVTGLTWDFGAGVAGVGRDVRGDFGHFLGASVLLGGCPYSYCGYSGSGQSGFFNTMGFSVDNREGTRRYLFQQYGSGIQYFGDFRTTVAVPEPGMLALLGLGLAGLGLSRRRKTQ